MQGSHLKLFFKKKHTLILTIGFIAPKNKYFQHYF